MSQQIEKKIAKKIYSWWYIFPSFSCFSFNSTSFAHEKNTRKKQTTEILSAFSFLRHDKSDKLIGFSFHRMLYSMFNVYMFWQTNPICVTLSLQRFCRQFKLIHLQDVYWILILLIHLQEFCGDPVYIHNHWLVQYRMLYRIFINKMFICRH